MQNRGGKLEAARHGWSPLQMRPLTVVVSTPTCAGEAIAVVAQNVKRMQAIFNNVALFVVPLFRAGRRRG
jgi:hypothetical protein